MKNRRRKPFNTYEEVRYSEMTNKMKNETIFELRAVIEIWKKN